MSSYFMNFFFYGEVVILNLAYLFGVGDIADRIHYDSDNDVQNYKRGYDYKRNEINPCIGVGLHDGAANIHGPGIQCHDLEKQVHGLSNRTEHGGVGFAK